MGEWTFDNSLALIRTWNVEVHLRDDNDPTARSVDAERKATFDALPTTLRDAFYVNGMINKALQQEGSWIWALKEVSVGNREAALRFAVNFLRPALAPRLCMILLSALQQCKDEQWSFDLEWIEDLRAAARFEQASHWRQQTAKWLQQYDL